jgi:SulP family sulfate permease
MDASVNFIDRIKTFVPKSIQCFKEGYTLKFFIKDAFAGCNLAAMAFPMAIAVAIAAGIDPEHGLMTAIVGGFLISLLSGSRVQVGGPSNSFIVILYGIMLRHGFDGMLTATIMAGLILIAFGIAGLGTYIKYIPYTVVSGLTTGMAIVIFSSQMKDFLGLDMGAVPINFLSKWQAYWHHFHTFKPTNLAIGGLTISIILYLRKVYPKLPQSLVALALVTGICIVFKIDVSTIGSRYGQLPTILPHPQLPPFDFIQVLDLIPDALTLAILAGIESLLSAVVAEGMTGWRHQSNCELIGQGLANIGSALYGGMPAAGSMSRTAANIKSGACSPISGMMHACMMFLLMFLFGPFVGKIPLSALSGMLIVMAWNMSQVRHFFHLFTAPKKDILVLITVFFLTVLIHLTAAVQVGMILAAFLFMKQMSDLSGVVSNIRKPDLEAIEDPDAIANHEVPEEVEVFEINGPLFFGVADRLKNILNELEKPPKVFILRMRKVPTIDASGMHALEEFFIECHKQHTILLLSGVKGAVLRDLKRYHLDELIGQDHLFTNITGALEFAKEFIRVEKFKIAMR